MNKFHIYNELIKCQSVQWFCVILAYVLCHRYNIDPVFNIDSMLMMEKTLLIITGAVWNLKHQSRNNTFAQCSPLLLIRNLFFFYFRFFILLVNNKNCLKIVWNGVWCIFSLLVDWCKSHIDFHSVVLLLIWYLQY